jgi:hypothetical protein
MYGIKSIHCIQRDFFWFFDCPLNIPNDLLRIKYQHESNDVANENLAKTVITVVILIASPFDHTVQ